MYDEFSGQSTGIILDLQMKGMSISFIDNQPQELINISMSNLVMNYSKITQASDAFEETKENLDFKLGNFQIDNLINEDMPVVFGALKLFPHLLYIK
jgi:hypothetical protein